MFHSPESQRNIKWQLPHNDNQTNLLCRHYWHLGLFEYIEANGHHSEDLAIFFSSDPDILKQTIPITLLKVSYNNVGLMHDANAN